MAGIILLIMGLVRFGAVSKYIPDPVIVGFTSGIAVIIWVGQWKDFFGLKPELGAEHFHEKIWDLAVAFPSLHLETTMLAILTLLLVIYSPRIFKRIPSPLIAMVVATVIQASFDFKGVATIGSAFGGIPQSLPSFEFIPLRFSQMLQLIGPAFTIALFGAIESLLSAVVADSMTGTKHDSPQELVRQGIANIFSPLFGGFASTGAIARTATNIRNGATGPLAGIVHTLTLIIIVLVFAPLAAHIPLSALSAILFIVAFNMSEMHRFSHMVRTAPRADVVVLLITFMLTIFSDLVVAVNIGVMLAALLFMKRMSEAVIIKQQSISELVQETGDQHFILPDNVAVYSMEGPFFFGVTERLISALEQAHTHADVLVLRMKNVPVIDASGLQAFEALIKNCERNHTRLVICEVRTNILEKMVRSGIAQKLGPENIIDHIQTLAVPL
jgi:SulP family sulfate permease